MNIDVPFFPNTPDNTHCFQAAIRGMAKYFWPKEEYSWNELDRITCKVSGLWTWPSAGLLWFKEKGAKVKIIEPFDYLNFIDKGGAYLTEEYGREVAEVQINNSDIKQEQILAKNLLE